MIGVRDFRLLNDENYQKPNSKYQHLSRVYKWTHLATLSPRGASAPKELRGITLRQPTNRVSKNS